MASATPDLQLILTVPTYGGMARLSWPGWLVTCPKAVTHPGTNRAWCRVTMLIESNALPLSQTSNHCVWT